MLNINCTININDTIKYELSNINLLSILRDKYSLKDLSIKLNVAIGTIQRWIMLDNIPNNYKFDLLRLLNKNIEYINYNSNLKDQFYTSDDTAKKCWDIICHNIDISNYIFIEPSAGDGVFIKYLPNNSIFLDIEPRHKGIIKQDYLSWNPNKDNKYIVVGNPPFGLRGHTALNFINHSYSFADYVCFILPQLFDSDGKGSPRKRIKNYNLIYSKKISGIYNTPENNKININCVFQIWSKYKSNSLFDIKANNSDLLKIYSLSDGGTTASTRNRIMLNKCDIYLPSTCFGENNMKVYNKFDDLPNRKGYGVVFNNNKLEMIKKANNIKWNEVSFLSTNSAYNLRTSLILSILE